MLKSTLLLPLVSVKQVGDLQALVSASCLQFGPNDYRVVFKPRHRYVLKALSTPFRAQVITLLALRNPEDEQGRFKGLPVSKQRLSHRIFDAIALTVSYWSEGPLHQRNGLFLGLAQRSFNW
ncbi:Halorhodopsin [Labeo rohita]|uniref:Halorhodopsin n=1 Tax=Labeo rohita TaxID=84645 RepID=A0ABQ8LZK7_LABRO|nr:Halorhodopsin [Labeo rohita]